MYGGVYFGGSYFAGAVALGVGVSSGPVVVPHVATRAETSPFTYYAYDMVSGGLIGSLPYQGVQFGANLDSAGQFQGTLAVRSPNIQGANWIAQTAPNRTCLVVDYHGAIVWAGLITTRRSDVSSSVTETTQTVTIQASELWSYFTQRVQATDYSAPPFSGINPAGMPWWTATPWDATLVAAQIISDAIGYADNQTVVNGNPLGGLNILIQGAAPNPLAPLSSNFVAVSYPFTSLQTIDTIVSQLAQLGYGTGFDYAIDVAYSGSTGSPPVGTINISYPRRGRTVAQNNLTVDVSMARAYSFPEDGTQTANTAYEIGGGGAIVVDENPYPLDQGQPVLERVFSRANAQSQNILSLLSQVGISDLTLFSWAPVAPSVTVSLFGANPGLGSFITGDDIRVIVPAYDQDGNVFDPRFPAGLDQEWRIIGWQANVPDQGDATLTLTLNTPPPQTLPVDPPIVAGFLPSPIPPVNTNAPTVTGAAIQGELLTATTGAWTGSPASFTYQWQDCDAAGQNPVNIAGATKSTYLLGAGDVGSTVRVLVAAYNAGGAGNQQSAPTALVVTTGAPVNLAPPTITGIPAQGDTLTASPGTWTGSPTLTHQWQRAGMNISGATSSTYPVVLADVGLTLNVIETATNGSGSTSVTSTATPRVTGVSVPVNTTPPTIAGLSVEGTALTCSTGIWNGNPTSYAYQWQRVPAAGSGPPTVVQHAQASNGSSSPQTAGLTSVVAGHQLILFATCKSGSGGMAVSSVSGGEAAGHSWSQKIGPITVGFAGTLDIEMWYLDNAAAGSPTITVAYTGTLSATAEAFWVAEVSGLTGFDNAVVDTALSTSPEATLPPPATANEFTIAFACLSGAAAATPPSPWTNVTGPQTFNANLNPIAYATLTGTTLLNPSWTMANGYWAVCQALFKTATGGGSATNISGATSSTYISASGDLADQLQCVVTATNGVGSTSATTAATAAITAPATNSPISQLVDNLTEGALSAQFVNAAGTVTSSTGGVLVSCLSGSGSCVASASLWSLVGSSAFAQLVVPAYGAGSKVTDFGIVDTQYLDSANNGALFEIKQGTGGLAGAYSLQAYLAQAGVVTNGTAIAYSPTAHSCLRIREQAGTIYWDTSPDGLVWTNFWSSTYTITTATLGALYASALSTYTGTESASSLTVENFNVVPAGGGGGGGGGGAYTPPGPYQTLVWSDDFTGSTIDTTKWTPDPNNEGYSVTMVTSSAGLSVGSIPGGGNGLTLSAIDVNHGAMISTYKPNRAGALYSWDHGGMFANIMVPDGQCCWPAFWLLDATNSGSPVPEIDILESLMAGPGGANGSGPNGNLSNNTYYSTLHAAGFSKNSAAYVYSTDLSFGYHVYGCSFSVASSTVNWYFDGTLVNTTTGYPLLPGHTFCIILTLVPRGSWGGSPTVAVTYPQRMYADWVKVFQ